VYPVPAGRLPASRSLLLIAALCLTFVLAAHAQYSAPRIFFSDLQSGPSTGGQDGLGAIVTIYGQGFGTAQNDSTVTIGGGAAASYLAWSDTRVSFQLGSAATSGDIVVKVAGTSSNMIPFTVRSGNVYFVSPGGNDSNSGSDSSPWLTLLHAAGAMLPGDIAYVMNGITQTGLDDGSASLVITGSGSAGLPKAFVAYPGAEVTVGSASGQPYGISSSASQWVLAGFTLAANTSALLLNQAAGWRIVGNDLTCPNGTGPAACVQGTAVTAIKFLGNNVHDSGLANASGAATYDSVAFSGSSQNLEVGWSNIVRTRSCRALQFSSSGTGLYLLYVHDNFIQNAVCSGISFANVNPTAGAVSALNNVISHVGTGPDPSGVEADAYACIHTGGSSTSAVVLANNTMYDCGGREDTDAGAIAASAPVTLTNNILDILRGERYFSLSGTASGITGTGNLLFGSGTLPLFLSSTINADPDFVSPAASNFQLQAGSPAIDAGVTSVAAWDFNGVPRPQGIAYDIGAFEYSGPTFGQIVFSPSPVNFGNVNVGASGTQAVTISNTGSGNVLVTALSSSPGFALNGLTLPLALLPGQAASFTVTFTPAQAGPAFATVPFTSDAANAPTALVLSGTGVNPVGQLIAASGQVNLGNITTGSSVAQTVTVTASIAPVTIMRTSLSGSGFSITGPTLPLTLAAGQSAAFTVEYYSLVAGYQTGMLSIVSNASNSLALPVWVTSTNPLGVLTATPASLSYGNITAGAASSKTITVKAATAGVTISKATVIGTGFSLTAPVLPVTLAVGKTATFTVKFAPTAAGSFAGSFSLTSNSSNALAVPLVGTGLRAVGHLVLSPSSLVFGSVNSGASSSKTITVSASTAAVTISNATLTGTKFTFTGPALPLTLSAGNAVSFAVTFAPTAAGSATGSFSLSSNASTAPKVALSGTGVTPVGQLAASPSSLNFGSVIPGATSSQVVTVTATSAPVTIAQAGFVGAGFSFTGPTLPLTLAAGQVASFRLVYAPTAAGSTAGFFSLMSNASSSPTIALSGTAAIPAGQLAASPSSLEFGNVVAGTSSSQIVTVTAAGAPVTLAQASLTGAGFSFAGPALPLTLAAGQSASFTLTVLPSSTGSLTGNFFLLSNAANSILGIALGGNGADRAAHAVTLAWEPSVSKDVVGYEVFRGTQSGGPYTQISAATVTASTYTDSTVVSGTTYYYVVTSVGSTGEQSAYSPQSIATIPTP
jgi:hypothetical protein